ncbi:hypothetical protein [Oerskovia enterophila]|uniref:Uncharacterized protein n=1 Tax=Oerskovia enterophila TaxID=43678 RepID=A0A163QTN0_9CELL|nr:hypothetical protein [Oerskovia enterophila]KZM34514.1 hypothetical protein OJAG_28130 [Oerskovia enterophila]
MTNPNALRDLIEDTMARNGWTQPDVVKRARAAGHQLSEQNMSRIKSGPVVNLVAKQTRALAAGLGLPVGVVIDANLQAMGFDVESPATVDVTEAVMRDPNLAARDRRLLLAVVRELVAEEGESNVVSMSNKRSSGMPATLQNRYDQVHDELDSGALDAEPFAAGTGDERDVEQPGPEDDDEGR